ncbi:33334_t:CDS:2, partial [Racocetra persica]
SANAIVNEKLVQKFHDNKHAFTNLDPDNLRDCIINWDLERVRINPLARMKRLITRLSM